MSQAWSWVKSILTRRVTWTFTLWQWGLIILALALAMLVTGCSSMLPEWRVGQKEVPKPNVTTEAQVESWRSASDLLARTVEQPPEAKELAISLSQSLGKPMRPLEVDDYEWAFDRLDKEYRVWKNKQNDINKFLGEYQGEDIEGTGINMFGFTMAGTTLIIIALILFLPGFAGIFFFVIRRIGASFGSVVKGVERFVNENPEAGEQLKGYLSKTLDRADKVRVNMAKSKL